jgi:hypothetical protein
MKQRFLGASVFIGPGKTRIAQCSGFKFNIDPKNELVIADGGVLGGTEGVVTSNLSIDTVVPLQGIDGVTILRNAMLAKERITISLGIVDGKVIGGLYIFGPWSYDGNNESKKTTGSIELMRGEPTFL